MFFYNIFKKYVNMKNKQKAKIMDKLLLYCIEEPSKTSISEISNAINEDYYVVHTLSQDLISQGILKKFADVTGLRKYNDNDMIVLVTPFGQYFYNYEGGALGRYKKGIQKSLWIMFKIIAVVLNSLLIIAISFWGIKSNINSKKIDESIAVKDSIINNQMTIIKNLQENITVHDSTQNLEY
jgi:predicted transcriptional regulator